MDFLGLPMPPGEPPLAVVPVLVGPLQALLAILPGILAALGGLILALFRPSAIKLFLRFLWSQKLVVAAVVLGVWGGVRLYPVVFPPAGEPVSAATALGKTDWSLWRGGIDRRGFVQGAEEPAHGKVVWSFSRDGIKTFYASPAIVGNRLYITSARYEYFKDEGAIYSVDADTGRQVWAFQSGKYRATFSSPSIAGKYLVVGEGLHLTDDARVFCLDVEQSERKREGVKLWEYRTKSHVECSPCIDDGKVYIGAGDDGFYCFALEPDEKGEARVLWHLEGEQYPDCETSAVVHEGKVYFGLGVGGQAVCCVDASTGDEIWRIATPYPVFGSPAIADGKLFVGMGHGDFVNTAEQVASNMRIKLAREGKSQNEIEEAARDIRPAGEVWCVDLATHAVEWKFPVGRTVLGCVVVADDRLYFGSRDKHLYCLSTDGNLIRKWNAHAPIITSPAVGARHAYVVTESGQLYGLDKADLSLVWDVSLNSPSFSSPVVARGHIYVGTTDNGLLCMGLAGREKEKPMWAGPLGGAGKSGWADGSLLPARGSYAWGYPDAEEDAVETAPPPLIHAAAAYLNGAFYVGLNRKGAFGLAKLDCGEALGRKPTLDWFAPSTNPVYLSAAAVEDAVFFVDGRPGDGDRALRRLDPKTGEVQWRHPVANDASGEFVITHDRLFIADTREGLTCLDVRSPSAREELWKADLGPCMGVPALAGDIVLVAIQSPPHLAALDLQTGTLLWEKPLSSEPRTGPVFAAGRTWVGQSDGVRGYGLLHGEGFYAVNCGAVTGRLVSDAGRLGCVTQAGELVLIDPEAGTDVMRIQGMAGGLPPLLAGDALLYYTDGSIQRYDLASQKSQQWARISASWPGNIVTPMIMVDSHVFFAADKRGFVCMKPRTR